MGTVIYSSHVDGAQECIKAPINGDKNHPEFTVKNCVLGGLKTNITVTTPSSIDAAGPNTLLSVKIKADGNTLVGANQSYINYIYNFFNGHTNVTTLNHVEVWNSPTIGNKCQVFAPDQLPGATMEKTGVGNCATGSPASLAANTNSHWAGL